MAAGLMQMPMKSSQGYSERRPTEGSCRDERLASAGSNNLVENFRLPTRRRGLLRDLERLSGAYRQYSRRQVGLVGVAQADPEEPLVGIGLNG